jgi:RNA polymerase sigma factor (sigma-70 family)
MSSWNKRMVEHLPVALAFLDDREQTIIHLSYWSGLSNRQVGRLLNLDHKTVASQREIALRKLRRFYGIQTDAAA